MTTRNNEETTTNGGDQPKQQTHAKSSDTRLNRRAKKPHGRTGIVTTITYLYDKLTSNKIDQEEEEEEETTRTIDGGVMNLHKGTSDGLLNMGKSHHVEASLAEAQMGTENVGVKTSLLSASAHCEYGLNNSAGVNASLIRAEGHLGPIKVGTGVQCDCNAAIGVNGVEACVLGTGFSVGPTIAIKTPFVDLSAKLF